MKKRTFLVLIAVWALAGCVTAAREHLATIETLEDELAHSRVQAAALERENLEIKREVDVYRKAQDVDHDQLLAARDAFAEAFREAVVEKSIGVSVTARGLDVIIAAEKLFVSGSDALSPEGKAFLDRVAPLIDATLPGHYVTIEGHTDNQPLAVFEWKSDWEFSFARSLSVLKYFTQVTKMDSLRFSAAGFGQNRPRATNDTKEGRSQNRRVELVISPQRTPLPDEGPPAPASDE